MSGTPRLRTLPEAVKAIQQLDPETAFTLRALRRMVKQEHIPVVEVASKRLVNLDLLLDMLSSPQPRDGESASTRGVIRRLPERIDKQWTGT